MALGGMLVAATAVTGVGVNEADAAEFSKTDLDFILAQIDISEKHAAGQPLFVLDNPATPANETLTGLVQDPTLPFGVRTVSGVDNNIIPGQEMFGAADRLFPRQAPNALFRAADALTFDTNGPAFPNVGDPTSYNQTAGTVEDKHPRQVSNLIVDSTATNPAAQVAYDQIDNARRGKETVNGSFQIPNTATDEGLSASYNSWFTFFGQFFDHGLDLVNKGGNGTVFIPLQPDDPLYNPDLDGPDDIPGNADDPRNFMLLTRATQVDDPSKPGIQKEHVNQTTPFVDQNQTYTSHPSHQVFLRQHVRRGTDTVATGFFLEDVNGGLATWADVKAQSASLLGITLTDPDVHNVPLLRTDKYGRLLTGPNGFAQVATGSAASPTWVEGVAGGLALPANTVRTGHAFLDDIAHAAVPTGDQDGLPGGSRGALVPDPDNAIGLAQVPLGQPQLYDDEMLARHFITGDGRGNENIALTTVHLVFHAEHNRLAQTVKDMAVAQGQGGDLGFLNQWLVTPVTAVPANLDDLVWNGERLFQAARFGTEMQYQHLVFEEFARKFQPEVNIFTGFHADIDPAIVAEFAHAVYRFGHSMLSESVPRVEADGTTTANSLGLIEAFLNPPEFDGDYPGAPGLTDPKAAAGAVVRGTTRQVGNELDEFVTGALRNNLLGLPLDLATINMARGRDTGVPPLNSARRQFFAATQHPALTPYESWNDFKASLRHPESLVNFIAAYGRHADIDAQAAIADKRAVAYAIVHGDNGADGVPASGDEPTVLVPADRTDFLASTGAYANAAGGVTVTGVDNIDLWIGGLAERQMPFGGLLGSTFNYVFETQMERLQDGDRFYYLGRTAGLDFLTALEENSFAEIIEKHTNARNLPFDVFSRPDLMFDVGNSAASGPVVDNANTPDDESTLGRMLDGTIRFIGGEHVVLAGDDDPERLRVDDGDDTVWGNGGGDRIEGGAGNDALNGEGGDDIITDIFGIDNIKGGPGNDAISAGAGTGDLTLGGDGHDLVIQGSDEKEVFSGAGDDIIQGANGIDTIFAGSGDDWIEGGTHADLIQGGNGDPFQVDGSPGPTPATPIVHTGHDVVIGDGGNDDYDSEGGNDIMLTGPGVERNEGMMGHDWVTAQQDPQAANYDLRLVGLLPPDLDAIRDRFDMVEALSGAEKDDVMRGDDRGPAAPDGIGVAAGIEGTMVGHELRFEHLDLITGLDTVLNGVPAPAVDGDGTPATPDVTDVIRFKAGNILLGGGGADLIEGRGGDDVIDGDRFLQVKLAVGDERFTHTTSPADGAPAGSPSLAQRIMSGEINPGAVDIVRSIETGAAGNDTAVFSGPRSEYTITFHNPNGSDVTVAHTGGTGADGTDRVKNVEFIQFADQLVSLNTTGGTNLPPVGTVLISDTTPTEDQPLSATQAFTDPDIGPLAPDDGVQDATLVFTWQAETAPDTWTPVGSGASFTPGDFEVGKRLRVVATYLDGHNVPQQVISDPTAAVEDIPEPPVPPAVNQPAEGTPVITDADGTPLAGRPRVNDPIAANTDGITDGNGLAGVTFLFQWQQSNAAGGFDDIPGATARVFTPTDAQLGLLLRVRVSFRDNGGNDETLNSAATRDTRPSRGGARPRALAPLALARAIVPATITSDIVEFRGVPVSFTAPAGTAVVQVRVFNAKRPKKALARTFIATKAGKRTLKLKAPNITRVLKRGGKFRLELTPGRSKAKLGKSTVKLVTVWKVYVPNSREKAGLGN